MARGRRDCPTFKRWRSWREAVKQIPWRQRPWTDEERSLPRGLALRLGLALLLLLTLLGLPHVTRAACAHGGNFRFGNPNPGRPVGPPAPGPPRPGNLPPPMTAPGEAKSPAGGGPAPRAFGTVGTLPLRWTTWWSLRASAWALRPRPVLPGGPVTAPRKASGVVGEEPDTGRSYHELLVDRSLSRLVVPYLKEVVDPARRHPRTMVGAALIAWARIARNAGVVPILKYYASNRGSSLEIRESAVLGLGLLRRSGQDRPLSNDDLRSVRTMLLSLFDDKDCPTRVRCFALYALGLLADQGYGDEGMEKDGRLVSRALWIRLAERYPDRDLTVALLVALGMQPSEGIPSGMREQLRRLVLKKRALGRSWDSIERSHALLIYARLGAPDGIRLPTQVLANKRCTAPVQAAGAIALSQLAPSLHGEQRVEAAKALQRAILTQGHNHVVGLCYYALGDLLAADIRGGSIALLERPSIGHFLVHRARHGSSRERTYAALATGIALCDVALTSRPAAVFRHEAHTMLEWGVTTARGADDVVAAYVAAAGLAKAEGARPHLLAILRDDSRQPILRSHVARALGAMGRTDPKTILALRTAAKERLWAQVHLSATRALSALGACEACDDLLDQLKGDATRGAMVAVALSVGRFGNPKAADRLVALAKNHEAGIYVRAISIVAMGQLLDPEFPPSMATYTSSANFAALTPSLMQLYNIR